MYLHRLRDAYIQSIMYLYSLDQHAELWTVFRGTVDHFSRTRGPFRAEYSRMQQIQKVPQDYMIDTSF